MDNKELVIKNIDEALERIKDKKSKVLFYVANTTHATGSVLTTYKYALYLHNEGIKVIMIHDNKDYKKPTWIGEEFKVLEHVALDSGKVKVTVDDIVIYPETHPDVMEKTKAVNCTKVVFCQTYKNILAPLPPGLDWTSLGMDYVIVVSEELKKYVKSIFHIDDIFIKVIEPSVDEELFYNDEKVYRQPTIPVVARNQADILELAKQFYSSYPEYKLVSFKDMRSFSIEDYALSLNESFLGVWLDRDASFGQFPVEALKTQLPIIALNTEMPTSHNYENITWVNSKLDIPKIIFERLIEYLNSPIVDNDKIENIYGVEEEKTKVLSVYENLMNKKSADLENFKRELNG